MVHQVWSQVCQKAEASTSGVWRVYCQVKSNWIDFPPRSSILSTEQSMIKNSSVD